MIKTILVPLTGFGSDDAALKTAYLVARLFGARIEAMHVRGTPVQFAIKAGVLGFGSSLGPAELLKTAQEEDEKRAKQARAVFDDVSTKLGIPIAELSAQSQGVSLVWREIEGEADEETIRAARYCDLIVLGRAPDASGLALPMMGRVLVTCGRPVLLAPVKAPENIAPTIAIAWKETAEAAGAVTVAMPFLLKAGRVVVLAGDEDGSDPATGITAADRLKEHLQQHGLRVETKFVVPAGRQLANAVIETAASWGADLLVMGAYSHSRLQEFVFGGFTQAVLKDSPLPILLFH